MRVPGKEEDVLLAAGIDAHAYNSSGGYVLLLDIFEDLINFPSNAAHTCSASRALQFT